MRADNLFFVPPSLLVRATPRVLEGIRTVCAHLDAVLFSTAIPATNVEIAAARERGIPVLHRSIAQAAIAATRRTPGHVVGDGLGRWR